MSKDSELKELIQTRKETSKKIKELREAEAETLFQKAQSRSDSLIEKVDKFNDPYYFNEYSAPREEVIEVIKEAMNIVRDAELFFSSKQLFYGFIEWNFKIWDPIKVKGIPAGHVTYRIQRSERGIDSTPRVEVVFHNFQNPNELNEKVNKALEAKGFSPIKIGMAKSVKR